MLRGELRRKPMLCQAEVDPACAQNALEQNPIAAAALWGRTFSAEIEARSSKRRVRERESATFAPVDRAALKVFGY